MKSRYTLVAILALGSVGIQGADRAAAQPYNWTQDLAALNAEYTRKDFAIAKALSEARTSRDIKKMLDNKDCTEWNPFTPDPNQNKSFLNEASWHLATAFISISAGFISTILLKKYLWPKEERDREYALVTVAEQNILKNLETDIQRLTADLPKVQKNLATAKNPKEIEYLKTLLIKGEELLQKKMAMHAALSQKFEEDQARRYEEQLRRVGTTQQPTPAA